LDLALPAPSQTGGVSHITVLIAAERMPMVESITNQIADISALCQRFGVARLDVFGSAVHEGFDPATSDVDLVVDFLPEARTAAFDNYFGLLESLQTLLNRRIDLITEASIRNPYLRQTIDESRQRLYGA
jgi:uncharacterized protein